MNLSLGLCAIFREESHWLPEWVSYYRRLGFSRFWLWCNDDDFAGPRELLAGLLPAKQLVLEHHPGRNQQLHCYHWGVQQAVGQVDWLGLFDLDEFLVPTSGRLLPELLHRHQHSAVAVNWACFGSSGLQSRPPGQLRHFLQRAPQEFEPNRHLKLLVRPEEVRGFANPHFARFYSGRAAMLGGPQVFGSFSDSVSWQGLRLNHYAVRSIEDWQAKRDRGRVDLPPDSPELFRSDDYFSKYDRNEEYDDLITHVYESLTANH